MYIKLEIVKTPIQYAINNKCKTYIGDNELEYLALSDSVHLFIIMFANQSEEAYVIANEDTEDLKILFNNIENDINIESFWTVWATNQVLNMEQIRLFLTPGILSKALYPSSARLQYDSYKSSMDVLLNDELMDDILSDPVLRLVLSQYRPATQVFKKSCAAHSIMQFLYGETSKQYSVLTEMEIYKEIWKAPREIADPGKIKKFLSSFDVEVILIEDERLTKQFVNKMELYSYTKLLFDQSNYKNSEFNDETFPNNSAMLIFLVSALNTPHAILANRMLNGDIVLQDPLSPAKRAFSTIEAFNNSRLEDTKNDIKENITTRPSIKQFSGLAFRLFSSFNPDNDNTQTTKILSSSHDLSERNFIAV